MGIQVSVAAYLRLVSSRLRSWGALRGRRRPVSRGRSVGGRGRRVGGRRRGVRGAGEVAHGAPKRGGFRLPGARPAERAQTLARLAGPKPAFALARIHSARFGFPSSVTQSPMLSTTFHRLAAARQATSASASISAAAAAAVPSRGAVHRAMSHHLPAIGGYHRHGALRDVDGDGDGDGADSGGVPRVSELGECPPVWPRCDSWGPISPAPSTPPPPPLPPRLRLRPPRRRHQS
jgi:hypothetical protein